MNHAPSFRVVALLAAILALPLSARAESGVETAQDDRWHFFVAPYLWGSGMEGTVGVNGAISVPVDLSFGDALESLDFAFLGRFEGRKQRLGFGLDIAYMNLGTEIVGPVAGSVALGADVRSVTTEGVFAFRVVNDEAKGSFVDLLGGMRWMKNRAQLTLTVDGDEIPGSNRELGWVDALAGARFRLGLGQRAALHGRADVAGFGSDFSWNVQGGLEARISDHWKTGAGYRYLDVDYDKGEGLERRIWKVAYHGPYVFVGYAW
jgi:opacity protein-like surface antigen